VALLRGLEQEVQEQEAAGHSRVQVLQGQEWE